VVVRHTPSTAAPRGSPTLNAGGTVASYEQGAFLASGAPAPDGPDGVAQACMTMTFVGDAVVRAVRAAHHYTHRDAATGHV
jgi:hypothetical protein